MDHDKSLLIIDSSSLITDRFIDVLKDIEKVSKILTAGNYNEAIEILTEKETDIVLLDIQLVGKSGIELLKLIAKEFPGIDLIVCTNLSSDYYKQLCRKNGAKFFIDKSKDFDKISGIIASL